MTKSSNKEEFIEKVKLVNTIDDFSKFTYKNNRTKGIVICPIHGCYEARPDNLLSRKRCGKCGVIKRSKSYTKTTNEFLKEIKGINKIDDFSKFTYTNVKNKGMVICPTHGKYLMSPDHLLSNHRCSKCSRNRKLTSREFIEKVKKINNKDNFDEFVYTSSHKKGKVICPNHGIYYSSPVNLFAGNSCPN